MKRMLFNATHAEELRVAIVDGQKLVDIDIESAGRESRKSNIYKGVITRIEPSLEACFVNYGEERHGFLPFKEISKSYFKPGTEVSKARIQDAISEGLDIIVQVDKEERGSKGAALTTFISLAGRYLVLMPNNPRGGGVSRRVEGEDRQELRETMDQLEYPKGMSLIARTAGIGRSSEELQWDLNYLMQLWTAVEGAAGSSAGPFLIYQESSLVIRAIRDYFSPDIGELLIDTDDIYQQACQFMAHVMPDMENRVKRYVDDTPLYSRFQIEHQIETAYSRNVPLPSGGSIVIDHTEALVAIDVNSARSTRGSDIEETALRTNLEAADEVARQMRLRDLGGLIVIDYIDMEVSRNQREVEQRLKDALHIDRARVQSGKISRFGLMELSRQRIRPALNEGTHITCPRCTGTGVIRDIESSALQVLRVIQEESMKENTAAIYAQVPVEVATYLLNEKRAEIAKLEARTKVEIVLVPNKHIETPHHKLERLRHDDERLATYQSSYQVSEGPSADEGYLERRADTVKPRQEAKVKGITPDSPAPKPVDKPVETASTVSQTESVGLFGRLFGWLSGSGAANESEVKDTEAGESAAKSPKTAGNNSEGRGGRNGRDRNRGKRDDSGSGRTRRGRGGANAETSAEKPARGRDGEPRRGRGAKDARGDRATETAKPNQTAATAEAGADNEQREDGRRRRRRRRNEPGTVQKQNEQSAATDTDLETNTAQTETPDGASSAGLAAAAAAAATALSEPTTAEETAAIDTDTAAQASTDDSEESPRKRSRRRRGRRGGSRDNESGEQSAEATPATTDAEAASEPTAASDEEAAPRPARASRSRKPVQARDDKTETATAQAPAEASDEAGADEAPAKPSRPRRAPRAAKAPAADQASDATAADAQPEAPAKVAQSEPPPPAPEKAAEPVASQAAPAPVSNPEPAPAVPEPVASKPPPAREPAVREPKANLDEVVRDAGLQMVETSSSPAPVAAAPKAAPRPRRVRKKTAAAAPAPLQQIETDNPPTP